VMLSLRARLLAAVLVLTAAGLLLLAVITYAQQRHFLIQRVDDQARSAVVAVRGELAERGIGAGRGAGDPGGGRRGGPPRGGGPGVGLPPGTYGQLRDASGRVLGATVFYYSQNVRTSANPDLPKHLKTGEITTVSGKGEDSARYRVLATADRFSADTTVVAVPLNEVDQTLDSLLIVEALVIGAVLLILAAVAWVVVRVGLLPLDRIGATAGRIAGGDLSHRVAPTDPRTEVGRLGVAINAMLDRLEQAFAERQASEDRLRQFIGDASHELRTPLASIRGYSELHRMGAARDPADVEKAMRRIEDEAARMGVLVEDLLTLARLDEVAEAPHAEVDVASLARDAVDDARATAPDRDVDLESNGPALVLGDAHQLRQVLGNLLRNALVHTPAGTPVQINVTNSHHEVRIEVRDHGNGLPTEDTAALFERFWRAEGGRERGKGGAGLGLAIVGAIVSAHGGRVEAANATGGGASFVVQLPAV
jgi:two-component system OmpR family sensor kinase